MGPGQRSMSARTLSPPCFAQSGPEREHVEIHVQRVRRRGERFDHHLRRSRRRHDRVNVRVHEQRDQARPGPRTGVRAHHRRTRRADRTGQDAHAAVHSLVGFVRTRRQQPGERGGGRHRAARGGVGSLFRAVGKFRQFDDVQPADEVGGTVGEQPGFGKADRKRFVGDHRVRVRRAGFGVEAGRRVDGDHIRAPRVRRSSLISRAALLIGSRNSPFAPMPRRPSMMINRPPVRRRIARAWPAV